MPTLNISLPAMPVLPAGPMPVGASLALSAGAVSGDGFAAMIANIGKAPVVDGATIVKPVLGTSLPQGRQDLAGDPQPLPDIDVEDVMMGMLPAAPILSAAEEPPAPAPALPAATPPADTLTDEGAGLATPVQQPIECGLQIFAPHGPHGRGQAQPAQKQAPLLATELPGDKVPDLATVEPDDGAPQPDQHDIGGDPDQSQANPDVSLPAPPPAFAPVMWTKPVAVEPALTAAPDAKAAPAPAGGAAALPVQSAPGQNASPAPVNRIDQPLPVAPPPVPANTAAVLPRGFDLPPDVAREVAELVRTASRKVDESAPLPAGSDTAPSVQAVTQASAPLHRDFVIAHRPAIDTSRGEWLQTMIDRIAEMPQADGRREAQIRLLPDALGAIDVKIEQRQDRVHVTLNAESAQTRQLLTDATPRLHELAEARGLRLGQTGVGGGEQQDRRPAQEQQPAVPLRPRSAAADTDSKAESDGDLIA